MTTAVRTAPAAHAGTPAATSPKRRLRPPAPVHIDPMLRLGNAFYLAIIGLGHLAAAASLNGNASALESWLSPTRTVAGLGTAAWSALAVGFIASAALLVLGRGWRLLLTATTTLSVAACTLWLPATWPGLAVDALVVVGLLASRPRR